MADRLTADDIAGLRRLALNGHRVDPTFLRLVLDELAALRADGPDQGDPAAHDWSRCIDAAPTPDDVPRSPAGYVCQGECRAPGAVAAAPPGGEVSDRVRDGVCLDCGGAVLPSGEHLDLDRHLAALAAPPAGHEGEAAVERAGGEDVRDALEAVLARWDVGGAWRGDIVEDLVQRARLVPAPSRGQWHRELRAAFDATRGPRTPDPGAGA